VDVLEKKEMNRHLPAVLSVNDLTRILGSRSLAYRMVNMAGFPALRIGKRIFVREDNFIRWMDEKMFTVNYR
jgi:hypothetical protein